MGILLTDKEIFKIEDELDSRPMPILLSHRPVTAFEDRIRKAQLKKVVEYLRERATFMEWEYKDSKGIWDIVLDDIAWQALLKEVE